MEQVDTKAAPITLTKAATKRIHKLMEEKSLTDHALRVFVSGGGCSGLQYGMALEGEPRDNDLRFSSGEVAIVVDPMSMEHLSGVTVDYVEDLMGGGFQIDNPNAVSSCGCGHSFQTADSRAGHSASGGCC
jgi:iron-sulfur cluster assembly protein